MPVIVVGNINVGGAGKTPLVIALGHLLEQHGIHYAVISKGYGGRFRKPTVVKADDDARLVGDEPLLIKLKCDCPVVVAKSRVEAANLVAEAFPDVQVILCDDGLQHYQLRRDVELCVINHQVGLGNGWLLPAGGLRETKKRLKSVDFAVSNGDTRVPYHYILADRGWHHIHTQAPRYHDEFSSEETANLAISGIAHPTLFFQRLDSLGINCQNKRFPDHHQFVQDDLRRDKTLLMTEKDWVKIKQLQHDDAWYLAVEAVLSEPLRGDFIKTVTALLEKNRDF